MVLYTQVELLFGIQMSHCQKYENYNYEVILHFNHANFEES